MAEAHEIFSDANRKAHMQPARFSPSQLAQMEEIAKLGTEVEDDGDE